MEEETFNKSLDCLEKSIVKDYNFNNVIIKQENESSKYLLLQSIRFLPSNKKIELIIKIKYNSSYASPILYFRIFEFFDENDYEIKKLCFKKSILNELLNSIDKPIKKNEKKSIETIETIKSNQLHESAPHTIQDIDEYLNQSGNPQSNSSNQPIDNYFNVHAPLVAGVAECGWYFIHPCHTNDVVDSNGEMFSWFEIFVAVLGIFPTD